MDKSDESEAVSLTCGVEQYWSVQWNSTGNAVKVIIIILFFNSM